MKVDRHHVFEEVLNWAVFEIDTEDEKILEWRKHAKQHGITRIKMVPKSTASPQG